MSKRRTDPFPTLIIGPVLIAFCGWTAFSDAWLGSFALSTAVLTLVVVLLRMSFLNYRLLSVGRAAWLRNVAAILGSMTIIVGVTAFIYNRNWEWYWDLLHDWETAPVARGKGFREKLTPFISNRQDCYYPGTAAFDFQPVSRSNCFQSVRSISAVLTRLDAKICGKKPALRRTTHDAFGSLEGQLLGL